MPFVLEDMTTDDYKRVIEKNRAWIGNFCGLMPWNASPQAKYTWAIDRDRNVTFSYLETWEPRDQMCRYLLTIQEVPVFIVMTGLFKVVFMDIPDVLKPRTEEIKKMIGEALAMHGKYGLRAPMPHELLPVTFE